MATWIRNCTRISRKLLRYCKECENISLRGCRNRNFLCVSSAVHSSLSVLVLWKLMDADGHCDEKLMGAPVVLS